MKTSTPLVINEGKTLIFLIPIIFCALAALISFVFSFLLGGLLVLICIILATIETGLELNSETMEYRKFKSLFGSKWGHWKKMESPDSFHLRLSVDSHAYRTFAMLSSPSYYGRNTSAQSKSITYDVLIHTKQDQWIILYEFQSYKLALQLMKRIRELESFDAIDHIAIKLEENQLKRANRRR